MLFLAAASASAQDLTTGYFNEYYFYRHELNPAFSPNQTYVALPGISNSSISMKGNIGLKDVLFKKNGKTTTFMNGSVGASEFLTNIKEESKIMESAKVQLLGIGFKALGGFNTIDVNFRENAGLTLPKGIFSMAKEGIENKTYDLGGLDAHVDGYLEMGIGHSHKIGDHWRVGAKAKVLLGAANIDFVTNKTEITLGKDSYDAVVDAELSASVKNLKYKHNDKSGDITGIDKVDGAGMAGFGLSFDLGTEYKLDDNWSFSLSFLDLGFINWNCNHKGIGNGSFRSNDYIFNVDDNASNNFDDTFDKMSDDLDKLYQLKDMGDVGSIKTNLATTMNVGANWKTTFYDKLSFGLLNTTRFAGKYSWTDFRLSANVHPVKWMSATASVSTGTFGTGFGWMLDLHTKRGIDFFVGMDRTPSKLAKQGIPLNSNAHLAAGLTLTFR